MERLTKQNPNWLDEELWISAEEPDDEVVDAVYLRLHEYENTNLTPEQIMGLCSMDSRARAAEQLRKEDLQARVEALQAENAELRELVRLAVKALNHGCSTC